MARINWGRVLLGSLVAGPVINVGELIAAAVLRERHRAAMEMLGRGLQSPGASQVAASLLITFGIGVLAVWLYAAIRPRFAPGPKTAIVAAVATLLIQGSQTVRFSAAGPIPARPVAATSLFALVEFVAGTLLGARWYTEVEEVPR